jgi:hypothetical protein
MPPSSSMDIENKVQNRTVNGDKEEQVDALMTNFADV